MKADYTWLAEPLREGAEYFLAVIFREDNRGLLIPYFLLSKKI